MKRDRYLKRLGLTVIRISDYSIKINLEGIMVYLKNHAAFDTSTFTE